MKKEEWRPAPPPYEGIIEVSDLGRIRRATPVKGCKVGKIFSPHRLNKRMYVGVTVVTGGVRTFMSPISLRAYFAATGLAVPSNTRWGTVTSLSGFVTAM
jgi:hypothetical protein